MTPIQQMLLGVGAKKKTYVDDVFSTYLYDGGSGDKTITNGLNMSEEGGMFWSKQRSDSIYGGMWDTVRGVSKRLRSDSTLAESTAANLVKSFNNNGVTISSDGGTQIYDSGEQHASWSFRKSSAFTVVSWTGNGSGPRSISHDLGSVPGLIMVKCRSADNTDWMVWHRDFGPKDYLTLNSTAAKATNEAKFGGQASGSASPTATTFAIGTSNDVNGSGNTYVAYVFAGGKSTVATARSVEFDGSDDGLTVANSSDFSFGSGDFTVEGWAQLDQNTNQNALVGVWRYQNGRRSWTIQTDDSTRKLEFLVNSGGGTATNHVTSGGTVPVGQWFHFAGVRHGNTIKLFINGEKVGQTAYTSSLYDNTNDPLIIGNQSFGTDYTDGKISNIRITKGQALYTSAFKVTTEPLTTTSQGATASNVKLLCCNNSSVTGSTVTPTTISNTGSTASTDSPFDDLAAHVFGESGSESVIKCGSYIGNGSTGQIIDIGFEAQWVLTKNKDGYHWCLADNMRGAADHMAINQPCTLPNEDMADPTGNYIAMNNNGFKLLGGENISNKDGDTYFYMAIRRPDGYVGKPVEAGTDVFAMGTVQSSDPRFISNFPVDFATLKNYNATGNWFTSARLMQSTGLYLNTTGSEFSDTSQQYDYHNGYYENLSSTYQAYMWKRHAGFDVVTANKLPLGASISHSLGKTPEMIIGKNRNNTFVWAVYHKGLNGGTNPEQYRIRLNMSNGEQDSIDAWNDTAPTATHFTVGVNHTGNSGEADYNPIFFLFASVNGISKVGSFTNSGGTTTVSCGFQPRLIICKAAASSGDWYVYDTVRGINAGGEPTMILNDSVASATHTADDIDIDSDGFTIPTSSSNIGSSTQYIFYAHA